MEQLYITATVGDSAEEFDVGMISATVGDFKPSSRVMTPKGLLCRDSVLGIAPQVRKYAPQELNIADKSRPVVKLFTPPEVLFSADMIKGIEGSDLTEQHPAGNAVTPLNWKKHTIGSVSNVRQDGDRLVGDVLIRDAKAIEEVRANKKRELSLGYSLSAKMENGISPNGEAYDAVIISMVGDHVALVKKGRGGSTVRIGDSKPNGEESMIITLPNGQKFDVQGDNVGAMQQAIDAHVAEYNDLKKVAEITVTIGGKDYKVTDTDAIKQAFADLDRERTELKATNEELAKQVVKPEDVERLAEERQQLVEEATAIAPTLDTKGKTADQIKSEVVEAKAGDTAVGAILSGVKIGDAQPDVIDMAYRVAVAIHGKTRANVGDSKTPIKANAGDSALNSVTNTPDIIGTTSATERLREMQRNAYAQGE